MIRSEWTPVGDRWVAKKPCLHCNGVGYQLEVERVECETCKAAGYVEAELGEFEICPSCKGFRSVDAEKRCVCPTCAGRGGFPGIFQKFEKQVFCETCSGTGKQEWCEDDEFECSSCEGHGYWDDESEGEVRFYNLREWKTSKDRPQDLEEGWCTPRTEDGTDIDLMRAPGGIAVMVTDCHRCSSISDGECQLCGGLGRVMMVAQPCTDCGGTGIYFENDADDCDACNGTGRITITEDREV